MMPASEKNRVSPTETPAPPEVLIAKLEGRAEHHTTPCGEGEMVWRRWPARENRSRPAAILLHGGSGSWLHWVRNIEALRTDRDVWAPDLPGFGASARPPEPVGFPVIAEIVAQGIRRLLPADETIDLVGFSFGSHTIQYVAADLGSRVATSVLVTAHMLGPLRAAPSQILSRWRDIEDPAERELVLKSNLGALMLAHESSMDPLALHIYAGDVVRARIRPAKFINDRDYTMIERLPCRVAGIAGALDPLGVPSPAAQGEELMTARPDARFHLIENAGHWVAYEAPDEFNRVVRAMLDT
jgi:2-hydroxy-6-oxonona-2,4-dienedioate hydrolase